jgi:hypothetical protein
MEMKKQAASNAKWKLGDDIVSKQIGDVCTLLNLRSGVFYTLNETASFFWKLIEEQTTFEEIAVRVTQEYDIPQGEVAQDLASFIDFLTKEQLLIR